MKAIIALTASLLVAMPAFGEVLVAGAGLMSCGQFIQDTTDDLDVGPDGLRIPEENVMYVSWWQGFFTGMNAALSAMDAPVTKLDQAGTWIWLRNYCRENPLDSFYKASDKLLLELVARETEVTDE